jgi:phosphatidylinositol alpha 1,6-mannosyltransferase
LFLLVWGEYIMACHLSRLEDHQLRVLIFTATYFVHDGVTGTIRKLAKHLRSRGATVMICSTVPENVSPALLEEVIAVPGVKIPFADAGEGYAFGEGLDANTVASIERFSPNIVHFTVPDLVSLDGIKWCQKNNIAYIGTWHSNYVDYLKYYNLQYLLGTTFEKYLKGFYAQIPTVYIPTRHVSYVWLFVCDMCMIDKFMLRVQLLTRLVGMGLGENTQLKEWGRGIDMQWFSPVHRSYSFRRSKGFLDNDIVILWAGRVVPEKRPDIWLDVILKLREKGYPVKGLVVGNGTFERSFSQVSGIHCCGWLSGHDLATAFASADLLLFPSDVETFGNVTLEALASGVPAIVEENCSGHLVEDGMNGFTCKAGDLHSFYQATKTIVSDRNLWQQMSKAARGSAWKYEKSNIQQQMAENYKDAIEQFSDASFITKRLQSSSAAAGQNVLATVCCQYQLARVTVGPLLSCINSAQLTFSNCLGSFKQCMPSCGPFNDCLSEDDILSEC